MAKIKKSQYMRLLTIEDKLEKLRFEFDLNDVPLNYGNGSIQVQLSCALAALDNIFQEL